MSDDLCKCGHGMMDHREFGCEDCMCERFTWPFLIDPDPGIAGSPQPSRTGEKP